MTDPARLTQEELMERLQALEKAGAGKDAAALQESEERMRAILQTAVEGIITIDERGIIEQMNPAAENIFGYRASEVVGSNVSILMPSPDRERHDSYMQNYLRGGKAKIIGIGREVIGQRKDGSVFPMDLSVSEVKMAKKRLFTGFVRDITDRKRLEREVLQISEAEQRRIGQDLHDGICQHLAGIEMMSEVLGQNLRKGTKNQAEQAERIAEQVRDVMNQTRSLARGLSPLILETEGLTAALRELAENTNEIFGVKCRFICPEPVELSDTLRATHLYRIAQEAIANAIRHGKSTEVELELVRLPDSVVLAVRDNGCGFEEKSGETKGMGLRIMNYRAGMIGGTLTVERLKTGGMSVVCAIPTSA